MGKVALLFTTRNCYQLFDGIFFAKTTQDFSDYHIFNIDLNSTEEQKKLAEDVFERHGMKNIPVDGNDPNIYSVEKNIELCIKHIEDNNLDIEWIIWCSHDGVLEGDYFLQRFESQIERNPEFKTKVGVIGFTDIGNVEVGKPCYGRGELPPDLTEIGSGWYQNLPSEYQEQDYFLVQHAHDNVVAVNIDLWKKHIEPDYDFVLFTVWDDICQQFGLKNIASVTIPSLVVLDCYREKVNFGLQRSLNATTMTHVDSYQTKSWIDAWEKKYGYLRTGSGGGRPDKLPKMYEGTILEKIHSWAITDGPKKLGDLS